MTPNDEQVREYTPEELRAIFAKFDKKFTAEKLIEYIEDDDEKFPADQVLAEIEDMVRRAESNRPGTN
jgi:hypothetical protein